MKKKIYIFSVKDFNTTASYFKDAAEEMGFKVIYLTKNFDVRILKPKDIFFYIDPAKDFPFFLEKAKCITVAYLIDVHLGLNQRLIIANFFDHVFIAQKSYLSFFQKYKYLNNQITNKNIYWLPLACDPKVHFKKSLNRKFDVAFIGQINLMFKSRYDTLKTVLSNFYTNDLKKFYKKNDIGKIYGKSKIIFNKSIKNDLNMRFFEGLCSGGLLVTDKISGNGVNDLFINKLHYISYKTNHDAINKINYYLKYEKKRTAIAIRGQKLVMKFHTYKHRLSQVLLLISKKKSRQAANCAIIRNVNQQDTSLEYAKIFFIFRKPLRILQLMFIYNYNTELLLLLAKAIARSINAFIPFTPQAIKYKFLFLRSKFL
jgi:hypothetical protein